MHVCLTELQLQLRCTVGRYSWIGELRVETGWTRKKRAPRLLCSEIVVVAVGVFFWRLHANVICNLSKQRTEWWYKSQPPIVTMNMSSM